MTTLTASQILSSYSEMGDHAAPRFGAIRALFARMAAAAQADTARCSTAGMSEHLLRDIGLTRGDLHVIDL
jgi:uncharacterized protein YjiS (DUF1127 family)